MTEEKMSTAQGCCQKEQPVVQMQCCPGNALPALQATPPSAQTLKKVLQLQLAPSVFFAEVSLLANVSYESSAPSSFNPHLNSNHRYLLSATLLL